MMMPCMLIVVLKVSGVEELQAGRGQFGAEDHGQGAGHAQQDDAGDGVLHADDFVVLVETEVAHPGRFPLWRAMLLGRVDADRPFQPVGDGADAEQETDGGEAAPTTQAGSGS